MDPSSPLTNSFGQEFGEVKFQGGRQRPIRWLGQRRVWPPNPTHQRRIQSRSAEDWDLLRMRDWPWLHLRGPFRGSRERRGLTIESLRPDEQECGFVRERWVPINRLTRRCRSTSGAHRLPLSTRSPLRRSRLSARIVRTLWDLSEQSFALSLNIAEVSRIPECSRSILYATT